MLEDDPAGGTDDPVDTPEATDDDPATPEDASGADDSPDDYDGWLASQPEWAQEEIRKGTLRQSAWTQKTQNLAEQRRELEEKRAVVDRLMAQKAEPKADAAKRDEDPADKLNPATRTLLESIINRRVEAALSGLGLDDLRSAVAPMQFTNKVSSAYRDWLDDNPDMAGDQQFASDVGSVIESTSDLLELARSNPRQTVSVAAQLVKLKAQVAGRDKRKQADNRKREDAAAAAPINRRTGAVVEGEDLNDDYASLLASVTEQMQSEGLTGSLMGL